MNKKYIIYILSFLLLIIIIVISYLLISSNKIDYEGISKENSINNNLFEEEDESIISERKAILDEISKEQGELTKEEIDNNLKILETLNP